jgi:hypothetical protein
MHERGVEGKKTQIDSFLWLFLFSLIVDEGLFRQRFDTIGACG